MQKVTTICDRCGEEIEYRPFKIAVDGDVARFIYVDETSDKKRFIKLQSGARDLCKSCMNDITKTFFKKSVM